MNCDKVKKTIDSGLISSSVNLNPDVELHIRSCESCGRYYEKTVALQADLNNQSFEIKPGELDGITFDNIKSAVPTNIETQAEPKNSRVLRWIWIPAAVAAVLLVMFIVPNIIPNGEIEVVTYTNNLVLDDELDLALSDGFGSDIVSQLIEDENDLDLLSEELAYDNEINDLIESLTEEELEALDKKLNEFDRSSG